MKYRIELRTIRDIYVNPGCYWETAVMTDGSAMPGSMDRKEYNSSSVIQAGQGLAIFGKNNPIHIPHFHNLIFRLTTNIFADPELLVDSLTFALSRNGTDWQEILFTSPRIHVQASHEVFYIILTRS